jgi:hypothetical protein
MTMTLLDRCANIRSQISRRNELRRAHKDAEAFRERAVELQGARDTVTGALARVVVLRTKGVTVGALPSASTALTVLGECQAKLAEAPTESGRDYGRLKRSVDKLGKEIYGVAADAIKSVQRDLPTIEEAFLKQVEGVPGYSNRVAAIRQQRDAILNGSDPNVSAEALAQFLDRREALRKLADELTPEEFPTEVLEFFKAGRHGGAPLEKLTTTVRQWLADRDLLKNVRVTVLAR